MCFQAVGVAVIMVVLYDFSPQQPKPSARGTQTDYESPAIEPHNVLDLLYSSSLTEYNVVSVVCRTTGPIPSGIGLHLVALGDAAATCS